jgi:GT2 family glycosyltransferase
VKPDISVVIPTHDRLPCLRRCLDALAAQRFPPDRMEVIVVADGCSDGTESAVPMVAVPFTLRVIAQPAAGAAAARNAGAADARGRLLLFLDDDVIATPELVSAHVQAHAERGDCAAVGPYLIQDVSAQDFLLERLAAFWQRTFDAMSRPGHRFTYRDVLSGNLSMPRLLFTSVGGFDASFERCGTEDYELGIRLLESNVPVVFVGDARARHLETTDLARSLGRAHHGGRAEVLLSTLHPSVAPTLRLSRPDPVAQWFVFRWPATGKLLARAAPRLMGAVQRLGMRRVWSVLYGRLISYWYWRGVSEARRSPAHQSGYPPSQTLGDPS